MAVFAADTLRNFKRSSTLLRHGVKRVARQALRRFLGFRSQFQDARHAFAHLASKGLISTAVLVFQYPGGVLGLQNPAVGNRFYAAMATGGRAGSRTNVFLWFIWRFRILSRDERREQKEHSSDYRQSANFAVSGEMH